MVQARDRERSIGGWYATDEVEVVEWGVNRNTITEVRRHQTDAGGQGLGW